MPSVRLRRASNTAKLACALTCTRFLGVTVLSIALLSFSSVGLLGCTPSADAPPNATTGAESPTATQPTEPTAELGPDGTQLDNTQPEISLPSETSSEGNSGIDEAIAIDSSQLPPAVEASVLQDIASNNNVPPDALEVEAAVPQSWPDGCLGLGGPDEICTFALVEGWEVTVSGGDDVWVYRTDIDGFAIREDTTKR